MKLHIQEPANGYTVRHVSITDEQGNPVCRIDWQGGVKKTNDLAMKITELWQQRDELLEVVREFVQTMDSLPDSNETSLRVWDVYDTASKLIEKMQRWES